MNKINVGEIYTAVRKRFGTSEKGDWEFLVTQDERGNNDIVVFVSNHPCGVNEGDKFRIEKINSVSYGNKKGQDGKWYANVSIDAQVVPVSTYSEFIQKNEDTFETLNNEDPDDLPF